MKINELHESTTSGAIATVATPMTTQRRSDVGKGVYGKGKAGNLLTGKKTNKKFANSIAEGNDPAEFSRIYNIRPEHRARFKGLINSGYAPDKAADMIKKKYAYSGFLGTEKINEDVKKFTSKQQVIDHFVKQGKTAAQGASAWERGWRGPKPKAKTPSTAPKNAYWLDKDNVTEAELQEDDLILVPGEGHRLKSGFMPNRHGSQDHEVQMARGDLYQTMKNSEAILKMIEGRSEEVGLEGWVQAKITKASDYLNSVRQYLESKGIRETGGVIAGGGVGESKKGGQKEVDDYKKWRKDNFDDLDTTRKIVSRTPSSRNPWQDMEDAAAYAGKSFKRRGN